MFTTTKTTDPTALAASLSHWWTLAGFDVAVQESPRGWLVQERSAAQAVPAAAIALPVEAAQVERPAEVVAPPPTAPLPDTLDGFITWLAADPDQPESSFSATRILPRVVAGAQIMIITDMPTAEDMRAGTLFSGEDGTLLAAMLRAIGQDLEQVTLASLLLARPAGGVVDDAVAVRAAARADHFINLVRPGTIIALGDGTGRALQQMNGVKVAEQTPTVNQNDGSISAMVLPAPFVLLKHAERKAAIWTQLRQLTGRK